jgi:signal transduction histidine kinase
MRRRLALLVVATTSVVLLAFLLPLSVLVSRAASSNAIADATDRSQVVVSAAASGAGADELDAVASGQSTAELTVRVVEQPGAPSDLRATVSRTGDGGAVLRQPVVIEGRTLLVQTSIARDLMREGVGRAWAVLGLLGVVLIALSLAVAGRLARTITSPIADLAATAERLAAGDLDARVAPDGPDEVREVGQAINVLATRIGELLAMERESVADLSHRLRTPITALRLEVEALTAGDERDRLTRATDELARQVDGLIQEARRPVREGVEPHADARAVVAERVGFWQALAEEQGRRVALDLPRDDCPVRATQPDLEAALDALLENVLAHTPEGAGFAVTLSRDDAGDVLVVITDEGPGFTDQRVLQRGESGAGSTGLGLDIARRTAAASGGDLRVGSGPSGGGRVSMRLGPSAGTGRLGGSR